MRTILPGASAFLCRLPLYLCMAMMTCLVLMVLLTFRWPLAGDAVSVHYLIFLLDHGMAPYRQIVDPQMPGTYLVDWTVLHVFGHGAGGLRLFDYSLSVAAIASMLLIAWDPVAVQSRVQTMDSRYAAFLAGGLFVLIHGRDGIEQSGQRDLIMAVLVLMEYAAVFHAWRHRSAVLLLFAGFFASTAISIKPTIFPTALIVFLISMVRSQRRHEPLVTSAIAILMGTVIPAGGVLVFLLHEKALHAFLDALGGMWPYYAKLQPLPTGYLLSQSISPTASLLCVGFVLFFLRLGDAKKHNGLVGESPAVPYLRAIGWERLALYSGLLCSFLSFVAQRKGFIYHRYPFLAFLLLALLLQFCEAWNLASAKTVRTQLIRHMGVLGCLIAALALAPICTYKISRFDWRNDDYYSHLSQRLNTLGEIGLSGHVQCLDAFSGCIPTLYRDNLVQSTGFLVDFYLFPPAVDDQTANPVVNEMRRHFWSDVQANPPKVFIVSKQVFPGGLFHPDTYEKLTWWPRFDEYLKSEYEMEEEWTPGREVLWSSHSRKEIGYRIYVRKVRPE